MIAGIISLVTLILSIAWGVIKYTHSLSYRKESLKKQIKLWEVKLGEALYKNDAAGITFAHNELNRLRKEYTLFNK